VNRPSLGRTHRRFVGICLHAGRYRRKRTTPWSRRKEPSNGPEGLANPEALSHYNYVEGCPSGCQEREEIMTFTQQLIVELIRAGLTAIIAVGTLLIGYLVGNRLSAEWAIRQKRRELELDAANQFHELYGELFALTKLAQNLLPSAKDDARQELYERVCNMEGHMEALYLKLALKQAFEQVLKSEDVKQLREFRLAFQELRQHMKSNKPLIYGGTDTLARRELKRLACVVALKLTSDEESYFKHFKRRRKRWGVKDDVEGKAYDVLIDITTKEGFSPKA
jgi:hypothetical protein